MQRAFLRLVLIGLLLVAQQAAVTHAIWHAHDGLAGQHESVYNHDEHSRQAQLCSFDAAFGQVLGGAHGSACHFSTPGLASQQTAPSPRPYSGVLSLSFHSRAPPVLL